MVSSWYLTHATKNAVWTFILPFFLFCRGKQKDHAWVNMKIKGMQKACKMQMHGDEMTYAKWNAWNDKWQMQERYVHYDAMKRCLCNAWYECIYGHESPKNHLFLLAYLGVQCPMCAVKKVIWIFRLPVTKDETNIQRVRDDMMQTRKSTTRGCIQYGNIHK